MMVRLSGLLIARPMATEKRTDSMPVDFTAGILVMYTAAAARANITANEGITFFTLFPIMAKPAMVSAHRNANMYARFAASGRDDNSEGNFGMRYVCPASEAAVTNNMMIPPSITVVQSSFAYMRLAFFMVSIGVLYY